MTLNDSKLIRNYQSIGYKEKLVALLVLPNIKALKRDRFVPRYEGSILLNSITFRGKVRRNVCIIVAIAPGAKETGLTFSLSTRKKICIFFLSHTSYPILAASYFTTGKATTLTLVQP